VSSSSVEEPQGKSKVSRDPGRLVNLGFSGYSDLHCESRRLCESDPDIQESILTTIDKLKVSGKFRKRLELRSKFEASLAR
jgi:hypothetical protein